MSANSPPPQSSPAPVLRVRTPDGRALRFSQAFHIGRGEECEVHIDDAKVSRRHVLVSCDRGYWSFQDLRSANGVFADGHRLEAADIRRSLTITLGREGPSLTFDVEGRAAADRQRTEYNSLMAGKPSCSKTSHSVISAQHTTRHPWAGGPK